MRSPILVVAVALAVSSARAYEMPFDPYPWCAGRQNERLVP